MALGTSAISTGDQEAILILLSPKQREQLSEREEAFVASLAGRKTWTLRQEQWFTRIWQRVMGAQRFASVKLPHS